MNAILMQLLAGTSGKPSAMRAAMLYAVFVSFTVWGYVCIRTCAMADLPEYVMICLAALAGSKVWQRGKEEGSGTAGPRDDRATRKPELGMKAEN